MSERTSPPLLERTDLTEEQLVGLMRDPRYWKQRDPAYLDAVTKGFQRLYPDPVPEDLTDPLDSDPES